MDLAKIKALIAAMAASDLTEMTFGEDGWTLRLVRGSGPTEPRPAARPPAAQAVPTVTEPVPQRDDLLEAPLAGVVYFRPAPEAPPFVVVGGAVQPGDPICVIEAMKVLNTVRAEHGGTVAEILVESGSDVAAGQPLLRFA